MAMDITATMARGRLRLPPMLSLDMVMDTAMAMVTVTDTAMEVTDTTATMARGRLRLPLLLSPAMDMVMDTAMDTVTVTDTAMEAMEAMATTDTVMDMDMATMDKFLLLF